MGKNQKTKKLLFFEFARGHKPQGKVVFEIYHDLAPQTAAYFTKLATLRSGGYLGSQLSKLVPDGYLQGGEIKDVEKPSVIGENFDRRHAHAGVLSLNADSCQFTVTLGEAKYFDGKNVVVGQVTQGMDVLKEIAKVPTDVNSKPRIPITITACGDELTESDLSEDKPSKVQEYLQTLKDNESGEEGSIREESIEPT